LAQATWLTDFCMHGDQCATMRSRRGHVVLRLLAAAIAIVSLEFSLQTRWATTFCAPRLVRKAGSEDDASDCKGVALLHEVVGEYVLPLPMFMSTGSRRQLWAELGVNVMGSKIGGDARHMVAPQPQSQYRPVSEYDTSSLRDMLGLEVNSSRNPGIRIEPGFVSEAEEELLSQELRELATTYGYGFASEGEEDPDVSWRISGRDDSQGDRVFAPWGWGPQFDRTKLPPQLAKVAERIESHPGYPLGPLRDVTVNIRQSVDYQMEPHIDPPADGPNGFVLSLLSSAVITFSPVSALKVDPERANDDEEYAQHSFTDEDIDCLVPRRAMYHMSGSARYQWTHAMRPPVTNMAEEGLEAFDRFGTWEKVLRRQKDRAAVIFAFADPLRDEDAPPDGS